MIKNPILFIIDNNGDYLRYGGTLRAINGYREFAFVISPRPLTDSVSMSIMTNNANYNRFEQYVLPTAIKVNELIEESDALYQTIADWNVFGVEIKPTALADISNFRSGATTFSFQFQTPHPSTKCVTYKGVFGVDNPLPTTGQVLGDYYECEDWNFYLTSGTQTYTFTKGMYVYFNGSRWIKDALLVELNTSTVSIPVEPSHAVGYEIDDDDANYLASIGASAILAQQTAEQSAQDIGDILDGTTTVKKAEQDKNGNDIVTTYETKSDATNKLSLKADKTYVDSQDQALDNKIDLLDERVEDLETANMIKSYTYNPTTHVITFTYYDNTTTSFDLPLESAIVSASYDNVTKDITFVLQSGATLVVPLDDLVSGLASETWVNTYFIPKTSIVDNLTTDDATKVLSAKQGKALQDTKEALANKATDFSVINDTKYPTTKAVDDALALKANITQEAWITPTLINGATGIIQYMKDSMGFVHFRGNVKMPVGMATSFMQMPIGYRVNENYYLPVWDNVKNIVGQFLIISSGSCYVGSGVDGSEFNGTIINLTYKGE